MLKQIQVQLHPPEQPHCHGENKNIDIPLVSPLLTLKRFHTFSQYFIAEFGSVTGCVYQQRSKHKQVTITKHTRTGTNYKLCQITQTGETTT